MRRAILCLVGALSIAAVSVQDSSAQDVGPLDVGGLSGVRVSAIAVEELAPPEDPDTTRVEGDFGLFNVAFAPPEEQEARIWSLAPAYTRAEGVSVGGVTGGVLWLRKRVVFRLRGSYSRFFLDGEADDFDRLGGDFLLRPSKPISIVGRPLVFALIAKGKWSPDISVAGDVIAVAEQALTPGGRFVLAGNVGYTTARTLGEVTLTTDDLYLAAGVKVTLPDNQTVVSLDYEAENDVNGDESVSLAATRELPFGGVFERTKLTLVGTSNEVVSVSLTKSF
jgi:hypothetical protein